MVALALCTNTTIEATANSHDELPNADSVFGYLSDLVIDELFQKINHSLKAHLPRSFFKKRYDVAIDITLKEYYGTDDNEYIIHSKAKNGTTRFYGYITCYVIKSDKRYTLYVKQLKRHYVLVEELKQVLNDVSKHIKVNCLYLDKQFYTFDCIAYLQKKDYQHIMPVAVRGRKGNKLEKLIHSCQHDSIVPYTISKDGQTVDVQLYVIHKEYQNKKGETATLTFAYCVYGNVTTLVPLAESMPIIANALGLNPVTG